MVESAERDCVFCEILARRRLEEIIYEDDVVAAFLCEPPATWGHVLVVPRAHRADIWSVSSDEVVSVIRVAQILSKVVRDDLGAIGVNLRQNNGAKAGQDVFHFHIHVVPRYEGDSLLPGCVWGAPPWEPPSGGGDERRPGCGNDETRRLGAPHRLSRLRTSVFPRRRRSGNRDSTAAV